MTAKIKKGDKVFIIAGKDKGKEGEVLKILGKNKAIVQGINLVKKHSKPTPQGDEGGIIDQEIPIDKSNLMLIDPKSKKPTRVGFKENKKGIKLRYSKKSGDFING